MTLTQNEYTVTDPFHFAQEICKQDPNLCMASLDVDFRQSINAESCCKYSAQKGIDDSTTIFG